MEASHNAVARHTSRKGHFTDVEEVVQPAVVWEDVYPQRHETITAAVDREVHQHHYHTTVQPLSHTEILPTKHTHNILPAKHTHYQHDDIEDTKRRVAAEAAQFRNYTRVEPKTHSNANLPTVVGEHWHHHVHEAVQPIIYKETIQDEIVHTTVPVHEVHYVAGKHHGMSALPVKTMPEFLAIKPGAGNQTYEGPPRPYHEKLATTFEKLGLSSANKPSRKVSPPLTTTTNTATSATTATTHIPDTPQTPVNQRYSISHDSRTSRSSSGSSVMSPATPKTPRSPVFKDSVARQMPPLPMKNIHASQPVGIAGADVSPRASRDSTAGRRRFF